MGCEEKIKNPLAKCANCDNFQFFEGEGWFEGMEKFQERSGFFNGMCALNPKKLPKRATDVCAKHSKFYLSREEDDRNRAIRQMGHNKRWNEIERGLR